jgi:N12 class adenine-specific DNA methylase
MDLTKIPDDPLSSLPDDPLAKPHSSLDALPDDPFDALPDDPIADAKSMARRNELERVAQVNKERGADIVSSLTAPFNKGAYIGLAGRPLSAIADVLQAGASSVEALFRPDSRGIDARFRDVADVWGRKRSTDNLAGAISSSVDKAERYIERGKKETPSPSLVNPATGKSFTNADAFKDPWTYYNLAAENAPQLTVGQVAGIRAFNAARQGGATITQASNVAAKIAGSTESVQIFSDEFDQARKAGLGVGRASSTALAITIPSTLISQGVPGTKFAGGIEALFFKKMAEGVEKAPGVKGRLMRAAFGAGKESLEEISQENVSIAGQLTYNPKAADDWLSRNIMAGVGGALIGGPGGALVGQSTFTNPEQEGGQDASPLAPPTPLATPTTAAQGPPVDQAAPAPPTASQTLAEDIDDMRSWVESLPPNSVRRAEAQEMLDRLVAEGGISGPAPAQEMQVPNQGVAEQPQLPQQEPVQAVPLEVPRETATKPPEIIQRERDLSLFYNPEGARPVAPATLPEGPIYHGSTKADLGAGDLSIAHANPNSYFAEGVYAGSLDVAKRHAVRFGDGSVHEMAPAIQAPIDLAADKDYSVDEVSSLGIKSDEPMTGFKVWRELMAQHGGSSGARKFLMAQGYDGVRFGTEEAPAYVAWTQDAIGKNSPLAPTLETTTLGKGEADATPNVERRGDTEGGKGRVRVSQRGPDGVAGEGSKTRPAQSAPKSAPATHEVARPKKNPRVEQMERLSKRLRDKTHGLDDDHAAGRGAEVKPSERLAAIVRGEKTMVPSEPTTLKRKGEPVPESSSPGLTRTPSEMTEAEAREHLLDGKRIIHNGAIFSIRETKRGFVLNEADTSGNVETIGGAGPSGGWSKGMAASEAISRIGDEFKGPKPAATTQGMGRQDGWQKNLFKARKVADSLGIPWHDKNLETLVGAIDASTSPQKKPTATKPEKGQDRPLKTTDISALKGNAGSKIQAQADVHGKRIGDTGWKMVNREGHALKLVSEDGQQVVFGSILDAKMPKADELRHIGRMRAFAEEHPYQSAGPGKPPLIQAAENLGKLEIISVAGKPKAPKTKPTREELLAKMREKSGQPAAESPAPHHPSPAQQASADAKANLAAKKAAFIAAVKKSGDGRAAYSGLPLTQEVMEAGADLLMALVDVGHTSFKVMAEEMVDALTSPALRRSFELAYDSYRELDDSVDPRGSDTIDSLFPAAPPPSAASTGVLEVAKNWHAKENRDNWAVKMVQRVPNDQYNSLKTLAVAHGGHYSSYAQQGAIPGFQFKTEAQAQAFLKAAAPITGGQDGGSVTSTSVLPDEAGAGTPTGTPSQGAGSGVGLGGGRGGSVSTGIVPTKPGRGGSGNGVLQDVDSGRGGAGSRPTLTQEGSTSDQGGTPQDYVGDREPPPGGVVRGLESGLNYDVRAGGLSNENLSSEGGKKRAAQNNVDAIRISKAIKAEGRQATPEEQQAMAKFVGWGALDKAVDAWRARQATLLSEDQKDDAQLKWEKTWLPIHQQLVEALTPAELRQARTSIRNAHFTSQEVIGGAWSLLSGMGLDRGNALEPSAGIGNFIGLAPQGIRWGAVELDGITSGILSGLYPQAAVASTGFQNIVPHAQQDLVISNFPFDNNVKLDYRGERFSLHDFFFLQGLEHLRPGGVLVGITSHYTLDKLNPRVRTLLNQQAEFLGAIRLPNTAFSKNAGTQVVTDVIFLQKKGEGVKEHGIAWGKTLPITLKTRKGDEVVVEVNEYFHNHPGMVLGEYGAGGLESMDQLTVNPFEDRGSLEAQIKESGKALPSVGIAGRAAGESPVALDVQAGLQDSSFSGQKGNKEGSIILQGKKIGLQLADGTMAPLPVGVDKKGNHIFLDTLTHTQAKDLESFHEVRDVFAELINMENTDVADEALEPLRKQLNAAYDKLVRPRAWGSGKNAVTAPANLLREIKRTPHPFHWLKADVDFFSVASLETKKGDVITKAPIFTQRVLRPSTEPSDLALPDVSSGYSASLAWRGKVDLPWMALKTGMSITTLEEELVSNRLAFHDPATGEMEPGHRYLSGNVRKKLAEAEAMGLAENVIALKEVQPERRTWGEFSVSTISPWVPDALISKFLQDRLNINGIDSHLDAFGKRTFPNTDNKTLNKRRVYGSPRTSSREFEVVGEFGGYQVALRFNKILESTFNGNKIVVKTYDDDGSVIGVNVEATEFAQARQKALEDAFDQWANENSEALETSYNENVNHSRNTDWPVPSIERYPGASLAVMLEDFQKRFVERSMEANALAAHVVGSGKTFSMVTSGMEAKRRGLARKPIITTLNEAVGTIVAQAKALYPGATIMSLPDNPTADQRRIFAHQVRTRDVDLVIMPMSAFNMIGDSKENVESLILQMEEELEDTLRGITDERAKKRTQKRAQASIDKLKATLLDQAKRAIDKGMPVWENFGFDWLMVDEAHKYKKLGFTTTKQGIKGIDTGRSQRAFSLYVKTRSVNATQGAPRGVVFATGTPVSNTMAELWTIARFLDPEGLETFGIKTFDEFVGTFSSIETRDVYTATQEYKTYDMLGKFKNGPEFMTWFSRFADRVGADQIKRSSLPTMIGGGREIVDVTPTPNTQAIVNDLAERLKAWYDLPAKERAQNGAVPMVIEGLAVNAAIDPRLVNPTLGFEPDTKLAKAIQEAYVIWKDPTLTAEKAVTAIFLDRFRSPDPETSKEGRQYADVPRFNAHHEIRDQLIELGIPKEEVYLFTEGTKEQNREAMDRINAGEIRVVLGTTEKGGTGLNIQERLYTLIHLDLPYNAAGITQREGRQIRSGNKFAKVRTISYGTKKTLDAKKAESIFRKVKFFDQFMFAKDSMAPQEFEDIGTEDSMSYNDMVGAFSGDQRVMRKTVLEREIKDLQRQRRGHLMVVSKSRAQHSLLRAKLESDGARMDRFNAAARGAEPVVDAVEALQESNAAYTTALKEAVQNKTEKPVFKGEVPPTWDLRPDAAKDFYQKATAAISNPWEWNGIWGRSEEGYGAAESKAFPIQKTYLGEGLTFEGEQTYRREKGMNGQAVISSLLEWTVRDAKGAIAISGTTRFSTWDAVLTNIRKEAVDTRDAPLRFEREMDADKKVFAGLTKVLANEEFEHQADLDAKQAEYRELMDDLLGKGILREDGDEITHGVVMDDSEASGTAREDDGDGGVTADMLGGQQIYEKAISLLELGPDATIGEIADAVLVRIEKIGSTAKMTAVKILNKLKALGKVFAQKVAEFLHDNQPFQGRKGEIGAIGKNVVKAMNLDAKQVESLKHTGLIVDGRPISDRIRGWRSAIQKELTVQKVVDQFASIAKLDHHAYLLARMSKGAEGATEALMHFGNLFLRNGVTDTKVEGSKGFIAAMQDLQGEHDVFLSWVAANRAEELTVEGRENLFRGQDITSLKQLNQGKMSDGSSRRVAYYKALGEMNAIGKSVLDVAEASGIIDPVSREVWETQFYVPFYRAMADNVSGPNIAAGGGLVSQYAFKRLKGGEDKLNQDLMHNVMMNWSHLLSAAAKNRAATASLRAAERMGVAKRVSGPGADTVWHLGFTTETIPAGKTYIENGITKVSNGTAQIQTHGRIYYKVDDPQIMEALMALESSPLRGKVLDVLTGAKRMLTIGVTASPLFKARNLMRDSIATIAISGVSANVAKNVWQGSKAMAQKKSQAYGSILASGAIIRFGTMLEGNSSKHLQRLIDSGVDKNTVVNSWEHVVDAVQKSVDFYNELGDISEGANRAALYTQMMAKGSTHAEAAFAARDLLDFTMGGTSGAVRYLTQTVPFLNARIQGTYRLGKGAKANPARFWTTIATIAAASIALMMRYKDDDDWKKREDWDRDNYWWFKVGGIAYRFPKPFEVGAIGTLAERSVELYVSDEMTKARFMDRLLAMVSSTFAINPIPQLFKPAMEVGFNSNWFTGRPIESAGMEYRKTADRYSQKTSEIGKFAGKAGVLSPVQIDHLVTGYMGWLGASILTVTNEIIRPLSEEGQRPGRKLSDLLLVGGFTEQLPSRNSRYATSFYDQAAEIEKTYGSWRFQQKMAGVEKIHKVDLPPLAKKAKMVARYKRDLQEVGARSLSVTLNTAMSPEQKRRELDILDRERNELLKSAAEALKAP